MTAVFYFIASSSPLCRCFTFDITKGHVMDEATAEGIKNGVTFVFLSGSGMLKDSFNLTKEGSTVHNIPGFDNTFTPSAGTDGLRINIHEPGTVPNPSFQGLDVPRGVSAVIGITSEEIRRLPYPYTNCSSENREKQLLVKAIQVRLPLSDPYITQPLHYPTLTLTAEVITRPSH